MPKDVKFSQKQHGTHTRYQLFANHLKYLASSDDGDISFIVPYAGITANKRTVVMRKQIFFWPAIIFAALGTSTGLTEFFNGTQPWPGLIMLAIAAILLLIYFLKQYRFTILPSARGQMVVLHDKQHDKIIDTVMQQRKKQLLAQYRQTNYINVQVKQQAIHWLWENEVISEAEYQSMMREDIQKSKSVDKFQFDTKLMN